MTPLKKIRLAGLWKKETPGGATLLEGAIEPQALLDALEEVREGDQKLTLTIWLNDETSKRTAASPDASLVLSQRWKKPDTSTEGKTVKEDVPF
jgi:hypothetical protein